jgi:hypothetical protein
VVTFSFEALGYIGECNSKCLEGRERILEVKRIGVPVDPTKLHDLKKENKLELPTLIDNQSTWYSTIDETYLFSTKFNLEVFGRLLRYSSTKIQLIDLRQFVPHWSLVVHHEFTTSRNDWTALNIVDLLLP